MFENQTIFKKPQVAIYHKLFGSLIYLLPLLKLIIILPLNLNISLYLVFNLILYNTSLKYILGYD